eukprot:1707971-Lingulodinium_polyedra.AAC.1
MPATPGPPLAVRDAPWDHGWGPRRDGSMVPMMRSRARWTSADGEDLPVGPVWQHVAQHLLYVADEHAPTH